MARSDRSLKSLNGLRAFEAAARHESFTGAATELNVSQAAISRIVRALEDRLGFLLFERLPNHLALTPQGKALQPGLTAAFDSISDLIARAAALSPERHLTVGVGSTFAVRWLIPRLARFHQAHPDIKVRVSAGTSALQFHDDWTCGIRFQDSNWAGYEVEPLFSPRLVPVCAPRLASRLQHPADLANVTLLHVESAPEDWPLWLETVSIPSLGSSITLQTYGMALQAALDGVGVALSLSPYVSEDLKAGRLIAPFPWTASKGRSWALIYRPFRKNSVELIAFRHWLLEEIAASEPSSLLRMAG